MMLYEISEQYRAFQTAVEAGEIPEEAMADTLEALDGAFDEKAEAVGCMVKEMRAEAAAIKAEYERLEERMKSKVSRADWLEDYLYSQLKALGREKFETSRVRVKFTKGERVVIGDEAEFLAWACENDDSLITVKPPVINKTAIKAAIKCGKVLNGAWLEKTEKARVG